MKPSEELRQDHQGLRAKLALLEALLPGEEGAVAALREITFTLNRELSSHAQREEILCAELPPLFPQTARVDLEQLHAAHHDQQRALERLLGLLWRDEPYPVDEVMRCVPQVIAELRAQMALEEAQVFPALEERLSPHPPIPAPELVWNSCDGMLVIDDHRRVLAMNQAMERLIGRRSQDVVGRHECGLLFDCKDRHGCALADRPEHCPGLRAMRRFRPVKAAEYSVRAALGRRRPVSTSYTPIQLHPGGPVWALVIMRDIRIQKRREQRLAQMIQNRITGPPPSGERRQERRVELSVPILVRGAAEDPQRMWHEGVTKNLSCSGAYFTVQPWRPVMTDDVVTLSITLSYRVRRAFPFSRLAGRGRVTRVEDLTRVNEPGTTRLGVAVAFDHKDFTMLAAASGNGYA